METIFKTGYHKIIKLFYENKHSKIHLRDIARKTELNENSSTRFLKQLEKENILSSEKDGNLKKYSTKKNTKVYLVFTFFDLERFDKLSPIRKRAVIYFLNSLREKPVIALLFGSTAKEAYRKDSDIDLLLVLNKKIDTKESEQYTDAQTGIKINCIQVPYHEFTREIKIKQDKVIQSALSTGYPVFNNLHFYEVYFHEN